jgi:hypothetical protein
VPTQTSLGVLVKRQGADIVRLWQLNTIRTTFTNPRLSSAFGLVVHRFMRRHGAAIGDAKRKKNDTRLPFWQKKKKKKQKPFYLYLLISW